MKNTRAYNEMYVYTFNIVMVANQSVYTFGAQTPVDSASVERFFMRASGKAKNGANILGAAGQNSGFLTLKKGSTSVQEDVPLSHIVNASSSNGGAEGWPVYLIGADLARSEIVIKDPAAIIAGDVIEITVIFNKTNFPRDERNPNL